jgi:predicted NBD/HSP70 family sugar kinase
MTYYLFDFGGTAAKGLKLDKDENEINEYYLYYKERVNTYNVDLKYALGLIKDIIAKENEKDIYLGLSIPGVSDFENQKILTESTFVNINFNVRDFFNDIPSIKRVVFNNDGRCATMGEYKHGEHDKNRNMILLTLGTSIGGGAIINGAIYEGAHKAALGIERIFSSINSDLNNLSQTNEYGTVRNVLKYCKRNNKDLRSFDGKQLSDLYAQNDADAVAIFEEWTDGLAKLIINIQLVIDVDDYYIGGGISAFEPFIDLLKTKISFLSKKALIENPNIQSATLKNYAGCYGALVFLKIKNDH